MNLLKSNLQTVFLLHIMLMIYSMSGICSKKAAQQPFLSLEFCVFYALVIVLLGCYAVEWQQIIKHLPLITAFANKSITIIWGMIWGAVLFHETITLGKIIGAFLVMMGVILYAKADGGQEHG